MSEFRDASSEWWAALAILGYGLFVTLPAGWSGYVVGHDTLSHLIMSRHFVDQLWAGDGYPRWLYDMNAGLGSPVFQFYGPIPYYITALFRPLVSNDPEGWHQLGLAASLAVIASGFTAYVWLRSLTGRRAAVMAAVLYMSAPYHLAVDLYERFAFAELWGFAWTPLVMLFARTSMRGGGGALIGLSVSYALLIMTHLPTSLLFSWVPLAYALWMAEAGERRIAFVRVAGGMSLGIALSAIFLLPAMTTQHYVLFDIMESGHFDFARHFLYYAPDRVEGANDFLRALGIIVGAMMLVAAGVWLLGRKLQQGKARAEAAFWIFAASLAFFMMLYLSKPVWEWVPVIQKVQFPWRFGTVLTLAMSALAALWVDTLRTQRIASQPAQAVILVMILLYQAVPTLKDYLLVRHWTSVPSLAGLMEEFGGADATTGALLEAARISRYNSFLPRWSDLQLFADTPQGVHAMEDLVATSGKAVIVDGKGSAQVRRWHPSPIELAVQADTAVKIRVRQLFYPGWVALAEDGGARFAVGPSPREGLLEVRVPPGVHRIRIEREPLPEERAGRLVSGGALAMLAGIALWQRLRRFANQVQRKPYVC